MSQGGYSANIALLGKYAQANLALSNEDNGGTLVVDPPLMPTGSATTLINPKHV